MNEKNRAQFTTIIGIGVLFVLLVFIIVPSVRIVQTGEMGVVRRFGVVTEALEPGMHFRLAFINEVHRYDVLVREADLTFSAHTTDAQSVRGQISIQFQLQAGMVTDIAEQFGSLLRLESMLHAVLQETTQNVFASKSAMDLVQQREALAPEIRLRLNQEVGRFFVEITNVALEEIAFGEEFERSIEQVAIADQARIRAEAEAARELIYAQNALDVARLEAEAVLVHASADAESLVIMQEAWGDLGLEVREVMLRQQAINAWDGVLPNVIGGGDFSLILDNFD